jgi:hypothetical protein
MGTNRYIFSERMLSGLSGETLSSADLKRLIAINGSGEPKTISKYLSLMIETGLIQDIGDMKFKVLHRE